MVYRKEDGLRKLKIQRYIDMTLNDLHFIYNYYYYYYYSMEQKQLVILDLTNSAIITALSDLENHFSYCKPL